jgi:tricorn protease
MARTSGYYMHPTLHQDTIVFVCEEDLWSVPVSGGTARRLTTSRGVVSRPQLSPDGTRIAFSARDEGPTEVYVMDAQGGPATRVSFLGAMMTQPVGWTADGRSILLRSNAGQAFLGLQHLYQVTPGGVPEKINVGPARALAFEPDGPGRVIGINSGDPARWKRYRGGTAGRIWIDRKGAGDFAPLIELDGNLAEPMWIGKRIYFLSDHEGTGNLYSCTPTGRSLTRHTDHEAFFARFPSTDGTRIVYHAGADLYLYDPASDKSTRIEVETPSTRSARARKFVQASAQMQGADLHPEGHSLAVVARGGAYTIGLWEGAPVRHGAVSRARERLARWLPDGKRLVRVSDEKGEEGLAVSKADGSGKEKHLKVDIGRVLSLSVAPAGKDRVALSNHRQEVIVVDLGTGKAKVIEQSPHHRIDGLAWSPDGRWLAYGFPVHRSASTIHLHDTQTGKTHEITRPDFRDFSPAFDPSGAYLYFLSSRVFDPVYDNQYFDLGFPRGVIPCLLPLRKNSPSPFSAATRAPRAPADNGSGGKGKQAEKVAIDLKGIADRVVAFPVPEARYWSIEAGHERAYFVHEPIPASLAGAGWRSGGAPAATGVLQVFDFSKQKTETVSDAMTGFALSMDRKTMLLRVGNRLRAVSAPLNGKGLAAGGGVGRDTGWIDIDRIRAEVDPGAEWGQMFDEAWRLQRDQFWVEDMSTVDWKAVYKRYRPLVDRVASRTEFSDLVWEMQGELGTSHNYELGGDYRPEPRWFLGLLGADLSWSKSRRQWVIQRIPQGDSWVTAASSPLAAPGLQIAEGDAILAVNGRKLSASLAPEMCLVNEAGRAVKLTVASRPRGKKAAKPRTVTVQTIGSDQMLRYRDWVETNRAHVHRASKGRVGYVHVPNMGPWGYSEFHRYFHHEVDYEGLIVDVRYNGGGHVSQLLLQKLARRRVGYGLSRWMGVESYPADAPMGPMVALTNEHAGSDGDIFSHCFKLYGLGPLIGKRTWGGVVGIWPRHSLVDGTVTTQSEFAHWFQDVGWQVENYGTDPDIEVDIRPQDWAAGRDPQMERGLKEVTRLIREMKPRIPDMGPKPQLGAPRLPKRS